MLFQSITQYALAASLALLGSVSAVPLGPSRFKAGVLQARGISADLFEEFAFYGQYAAAAYCPGNNNSTNTKVTCATHNCPYVEAADTTTLAEFENSATGDVTGFLALDKTNQLLVLAFRGSSSKEAWYGNLDFFRTDSDLCYECSIHNGYWQSWLSVAKKLTAEVKKATRQYPNHRLIVTGHSAGAAMATVTAGVLRSGGQHLDLFGYAGPRIGNEELAAFLSTQGPGRSFRITHDDDPVPRLPPRHLGYSHTSPEYWITSGNDVQVHPKDIKVITEVDSDYGNAGTISLDIRAHDWYFNDISAC